VPAALLTSPLGLPKGALKPRVETHPPFLFSYGDVGCDLMVRAGRTLDEWQADALALMLAVRPDGKWACFEYCEWVARQNGKGGILEARVLTGLLVLGEELILWSAHEYKTAMEAFRRIKALIRVLGEQVDKDGNLFDVDGILIKVNNTNGEEAFERLDTGARIKFVARSKGSGKGFSADVIIIDEAFAYTSIQHEALLYTLSARSVTGNPQIIYTSSPPLTGETGDVMYALRLRGDPTAVRPDDFPEWEQDDSLGYRDWGLPGEMEFLDGIDLDDIANWAATNPGLGIRITQETVSRERRASLANPAGFARERLGMWPRWARTAAEGWKVISRAQWTSRRRADSQLDGRPAFALVVPPDRSFTAIGVAGSSTAGGKHVEITGDGRILDYRPGTAWAIPRLVELEKHNPSVVIIDDKALADEAEAAGLVIHRANAADVVTGCQLLYDGVADPDEQARDVWHIGQEDLTVGVAGAVKRNVGTSWAWARRDVTVDTTAVAAVSLALRGHCAPQLRRPELVPMVAWR
jgi:hypothetical protein